MLKKINSVWDIKALDKFDEEFVMRTIFRTVLLIFLPMLSLLFVQAEKGHLRIVHKPAFTVCDHSDVESSSSDDEIFSPVIDDNADDCSESVVRNISAFSISNTIEFFNSFKFKTVLPVACVNAYRKNSPSFLKVFRI